jgi:hypothetical protein
VISCCVSAAFFTSALRLSRSRLLNHSGGLVRPPGASIHILVDDLMGKQILLDVLPTCSSNFVGRNGIVSEVAAKVSTGMTWSLL